MSECEGFNLVIDSAYQIFCLLMKEDVQQSETRHLLKKTILMSGRKQHLKNFNCLERSFAFETFRNRRPSHPDDVLKSFNSSSITDCLNECLHTDSCLSAVFNSKDSVCLLSRISINYVYNVRKTFIYDENYDIYENNCFKVPINEGACSWMRVKYGGIPDLFDSQQTAHHVDHCEQLCLQRSQTSDICRSYTFDQTRNLCLMSSSNSRIMGRSPLEFQNKNYFHGDLDDCMDLSLKCRLEHLDVEGWTLRQFSGNLKTKRSRDVICHSDVKKTFRFSSKFDYESCGLNRVKEPIDAYHGSIHLKEGSTSLVTVRDKVLQVECRIHPQIEKYDRVLSVNMNVSDSENSRLLSEKVIILPKLNENPVPKFSLSVLSENGKAADKIRIGEKAWLRIRMNSKEPSGSFLVTKVIAKEILTNRTMELVDSEGCVSVNESVIDFIHLNNSAPAISFRLNVGAFKRESELIYQAYVVACDKSCQPSCNKHLFEQKATALISSPIAIVERQKRSITARQIELSQDIYKVYANKLHVLGSSDDTITSEHVEKISYNSLEFSVQRCFVDDVTCLFTALLGFIQLFLFVACFISMYCYYMQWRRYQLARSSMNQIQIQQTLK
ncbi:unnamed protein product [Auanema sp. JU1783]|nr:unnamed protein product [Auanema sp. JU1783]